METKRATPKKEETVTLLLSDKFLKEMSSELVNFNKKQLNLSLELNEISNRQFSSVPGTDRMPSSVFSRSFFSQKIEKPVFTIFIKKDRQQKATEKLLKEMTGVYCKQLDIVIEKNKEVSQ